MPAMVCRKPIQKDTKQLVDSARTQLYSSGSQKPHHFDALGSSFEKGRLSAVALSIIPRSGSQDRFKPTYSSDPDA